MLILGWTYEIRPYFVLGSAVDQGFVRAPDWGAPGAPRQSWNRNKEITSGNYDAIISLHSPHAWFLMIKFKRSYINNALASYPLTTTARKSIQETFQSITHLKRSLSQCPLIQLQAS